MTGAGERLAGWGRYPVIMGDVHRFAQLDTLTGALPGLGPLIARGNGRSYGDASLSAGGMIATLGCDRLLAFDPTTGVLTCESGLLLDQLIDVMLPRGWWPAVTPGTCLVTIGGMIASDVHGKNHHGHGSFCDHVRWLDLDMGSGAPVRCSREENAELFAATCGGMGLTGVILRAAFGLIPVETAWIRQRTLKARDLGEAFDHFEATLDATYSVAWIDCLASGAQLGRSVVLTGEHALRTELAAYQQVVPLARRRKRARRIPIDIPAAALSRPFVRAFNGAYYAAHRAGERLVDADSYFYPLDALRDWNRIYGRRGFVQYQCVVPLAGSRPALTLILKAIAATGRASFLAVLKRMGPASFGMLSFPTEGYTLALDFPADAANLALLDRLDAITAEHGGRLYLAKDARQGRGLMASGYPRLAEFRALRQRLGLDRRFTSLLSERLDL